MKWCFDMKKVCLAWNIIMWNKRKNLEEIILLRLKLKKYVGSATAQLQYQADKSLGRTV